MHPAAKLCASGFPDADVEQELIEGYKNDLISKWHINDAGAAQVYKPGKVMNVLETLADWQGVDTLNMARLLVGMTTEARTELRTTCFAAMKGREETY